MADRGPISRLRRIAALVGLGFRRTLGKAKSGSSRRLLLSLTGVAVAIMLMITVSGVALGLASQSAVQSEDVDYWVVPEGGSLNTIAVSTEGPQLGATHGLTERLQRDERVRYATPVLMQVVPVESPSGDAPEYILFVGVIAPEDTTPTIAGLSTASLQTGDPYYDNGTYNGTWTGEVVVNAATAELLNASNGSAIVPTGEAPGPLRVEAVSDGEFQTGIGAAPVALVHLSELQATTGATGDDAADQLLVSTNDPAVRERLTGLYPNTVVVTRAGIAAQETSLSSLPVAMGVAALVVALLVGLLFTATMMGLEVTNDRTALATFTALGYSERSLSVLVVAETVSLAALGGLLGVALGALGIVATNGIVAATLGVPSLALLRPELLGYGFAVALLIGLLSAPYPIWLSRRTDALEVMRR
ncbi:ABC transporter permease [Halobellus ordinarius]|uniref:ABC transporter permease n=1 Tax=Halobellus ordinarius TaxID=3075120 RepID=UPI0028803023|nr:ABC transporter permease [Halobellus sp. ZY16]